VGDGDPVAYDDYTVDDYTVDDDPSGSTWTPSADT